MPIIYTPLLPSNSAAIYTPLSLSFSALPEVPHYRQKGHLPRLSYTRSAAGALLRYAYVTPYGINMRYYTRYGLRHERYAAPLVMRG